MPKKYSQEYIDRARGVFAEVGTYGATARILGVSEPWVRKVILEAGMSSKREGTAGRPSRLEGKEEEIIRLAAEGLSAQQIKERLGLKVHKETIGSFLRRRNATRLLPGGQHGELNPAWRGGKHIDKSGYVLVRAVDHPDRNSNGYVREHRLVMERVLGRRLLPSEVVHHINGDKQDNRPENLEIFESNAAHLGETLKGKVPEWTPEGLENISQGSSAYMRSAAGKEQVRRLHAGRDKYLRERRDEVLQNAAHARSFNSKCQKRR